MCKWQTVQEKTLLSIASPDVETWRYRRAGGGRCGPWKAHSAADTLVDVGKCWETFEELYEGESSIVSSNFTGNQEVSGCFLGISNPLRR